MISSEAVKNRRERHKITQRAWRKKNIEKVRAADRARYSEKRRACVRAWRERNTEKSKALSRAWYKRNPVDGRRIYFVERRLKRHGLSLRAFIEMAVQQEAKCAICGTQGKLVVDHCHSSGKVRGLLCRKCNVGIGQLLDSPAVLTKALVYLHANQTLSQVRG